MDGTSLGISRAAIEAFAKFVSDDSLLALPLALKDGTLETLPPVLSKHPTESFQIALNELDAVLSPRIALYLLLRRNGSLTAITYVPFLAHESERQHFLNNRNSLVQQLGQEHFAQSLICKELGEITDARSWQERDDNEVPSTASTHSKECNDETCKTHSFQDLGYKRNKCRLCDRRMQNKISPTALSALQTLHHPGTMVQIHVDPKTQTLALALTQPTTHPSTIPSLIPPISPSFTFYTHPDTSLLYFIFHSPDSAAVQVRMTHTLAIPGLLVHAGDVGVHVDRKVEVHEPGEVVFEEGDGTAGKYRSMFVRREGFKGTEAVYEGMDRAEG